LVADVREWCAGRQAALADRFASDDERKQTLEELADSQRRIVELQARLELARLASGKDDSLVHVTARASDPLLVPQLLRARVLGEQSRALLGRHDLIDIGARDDIQSDAFVLDPPDPMLDVGEDEQLEAGRLVLAGSRVWGKVLHVGPLTSTVRRVADRGYRDLVQLASLVDGRIEFGPRGVLEGTGERLCRIRLVEGVEPVAVGDRVYSVGTEGLLAEPLIYGTVVRAELPSGATHWEITMQPAASFGDARHLAVLRTELNPSRVAAKPSAESR
jgi:cell shape-determining protein MreC